MMFIVMRREKHLAFTTNRQRFSRVVTDEKCGTVGNGRYVTERHNVLKKLPSVEVSILSNWGIYAIEIVMKRKPLF